MYHTFPPAASFLIDPNWQLFLAHAEPDPDLTPFPLTGPRSDLAPFSLNPVSSTGPDAFPQRLKGGPSIYACNGPHMPVERNRNATHRATAGLA